VPYYIAKPTSKIIEQKTRIISAKTQSQALKHAVRDFYQIDIATPEQLVALLEKGVKAEVAGPEASETPEKKGEQ